MENIRAQLGTVVAILVLAVLVVAGLVLLWNSRPEPVALTINPPVPTATPEPTPTPAPVLVYVTGAVNMPEQTVELPAGSRVGDALDVVGGVTEDADMTRINVAGVVRDGDHVHVFAVGEGDDVPLTEADLPTPGGGGLVYVNTATLEELDTLPGIGPAIAQRILDYRGEFGPFADLESMSEVSGIGPATIADLDGLVGFD